MTDRSTPSRHERRIARIVMRIGEKTERYARYLAGGLAGASTLLGTLVGFDARLLLPTGVLLVAAGVLVVAHDRWLTSRALQRELDIAADRVAVEASSTAELEALAERHSVVADAFAEIASAAADMADMSKRERARAFERLVKQSVDAIAYLLHGDIAGVRAVVYQVDSAGTLLEPVDKASNGYRQPPSPFVAGTVRGDTAFEILRSGRSLFVDDITTAPGDWAESGNGYNTFITTRSSRRPVHSASSPSTRLSLTPSPRRTRTICASSRVSSPSCSPSTADAPPAEAPWILLDQWIRP